MTFGQIQRYDSLRQRAGPIVAACLAFVQVDHALIDTVGDVVDIPLQRSGRISILLIFARTVAVRSSMTRIACCAFQMHCRLLAPPLLLYLRSLVLSWSAQSRRPW